MFLYCLMCVFFLFFFFKQKTAYEMRISDWSSDVCSSDLVGARIHAEHLLGRALDDAGRPALGVGQGEDVGEVVLALRIVAAKPLDEREETLRLAQHDAGVAEIDLTLRAVGVGKLDDLLDAPFLIEDDAPVSGRVGWPEAGAEEVGSRSEEHT